MKSLGVDLCVILMVFVELLVCVKVSLSRVVSDSATL